MKRTAMLVAITYTAALALWAIGRLARGEAAELTGIFASGVLLITQCTVVVIIMPWMA